MAWQGIADRYVIPLKGASIFIINAQGIVASAGPCCGNYSFDGPTCQKLMGGCNSGDKNKLILVRTTEAFHYHMENGEQHKCETPKKAHLFRQGQNSYILFDGYAGDDWKVLALYEDTKLENVLDLFYNCTDRCVIPEI